MGEWISKDFSFDHFHEDEVSEFSPEDVERITGQPAIQAEWSGVYRTEDGRFCPIIGVWYCGRRRLMFMLCDTEDEAFNSARQLIRLFPNTDRDVEPQLYETVLPATDRPSGKWEETSGSPELDAIGTDTDTEGKV